MQNKEGKKNNGEFIPVVLQALSPPASDLCSGLNYGAIIAQEWHLEKSPGHTRGKCLCILGCRDIPASLWDSPEHSTVPIHQEQFPLLTSICPIVSWYSLSLVLKKDSVSWIKFPRFSSCRGKEDTKNQQGNKGIQELAEDFI